MKSVKWVKNVRTSKRERIACGGASLSTRHSPLATSFAFTLIELLVVIAIMAILAALIIPITGAVTRTKLRSRTRAELRSIESAIENYRAKKGYYPPDNPGNGNFLNQLYYELSGTVYSNGVYVTLDGGSVLDTAAVNLRLWEGISRDCEYDQGVGR